MSQAYSMDLRERAMARVAAGESARSVAAVLSVSPSSVIKWGQRLRAKGSVAPGRVGGYRPKAIIGEHRVWLLERVGSDFTLRGLVAELSGRGLKVDYRTVWSFVHAERLSFKKKRPSGRAKPA
jgi:putative transposase